MHTPTQNPRAQLHSKLFYLNLQEPATGMSTYNEPNAEKHKDVAKLKHPRTPFPGRFSGTCSYFFRIQQNLHT